MTEPITIYWAPTLFDREDQITWEMLYQEPTSVASRLMSSTGKKGLIRSCPAVKDSFKNLFEFKGTIDDNFILSKEQLQEAGTFPDGRMIASENKVAVLSPRRSSFPGYVNINYNLSWLMFASEPVEVEFFPPFFPMVSPCKNAFLAVGKMDIGKWYRPFNLDYHVPIEDQEFNFKANDPLFYLKVHTEKKVKFERYVMTQRLRALSGEAVRSPAFTGANQPLEGRYKFAAMVGMPQLVLSEIKKNLVGN